MPSAGRQITTYEALALCYAVGFRSGNLTTAVALMAAESARFTGAWHVNYPGSLQESTDRGLFQINDKWHQDLSDSDAYDPVKNAAYAFKMSSGRWFTPWAAYNSGAYKQNVRSVRLAKVTRPWRWRRLVKEWTA
jgi:malate synthase